MLDYEVYKGYTYTEGFAWWLKHKLLLKYGKVALGEANSVIIMDNASFHYSDEISAMSEKAGVKLIYLPPYSPDLNPIEEYFGELKAFIKKHNKLYLEDGWDFKAYLKWCVEEVGNNTKHMRNHFRNALIDVPY